VQTVRRQHRADRGAIVRPKSLAVPDRLTALGEPVLDHRLVRLVFAAFGPDAIGAVGDEEADGVLGDLEADRLLVVPLVRLDLAENRFVAVAVGHAATLAGP